MSELLQAAKAVISAWDDQYRSIDMRLKNLRAAVERAEKQDAVGFEEWWVTPNGCLNKYECETAWTAAQQAERERIKKMIGDMIDQDDPWIHFSTLLEMID